MKTKKAQIIRICLYCLSGLLVLYTFWAIINCYQQISLSIKQGQLVVSGNEFIIMNYYMTNCLEYGIFAVILFSFGWMVRQPSNMGEAASEDTEKIESSQANTSLEEDEEDFQGWDKMDNP